ncbi:hypothetical protein A3D62_02205 [Candidatus Kaiserbacteria bacterium RIFCSPHIGHO2_02_FULL_49_11]|uniref:ParB-like N-terminal domain-containing protein n=1 Tax=Candidatus Kaiserbacteria bacterium RIFCSPHIGHO2_02_FULL_49_11 TaxID=1798489 RepID=A0A1F6D080_9BACT|nr:MAG: hypothetical protein A3D62_02205 [Candidatus Kaiserbacteria bacterium RIFCSPHIGHO2_02_FULL_49_11]
MANFYNDSIFWVEVEKVRPNPFQPRKEFDPSKLQDLADSIRQYGVLQPLVVTRHEIAKDDGGLATEYELIAGERRLRASRLAGLSQVPVIIRTSDETDKMKLELAIIENLQREDLNPIDRAHAFKRLVEEFGLKHGDVGRKVGKSREYVSNSLRLLALPEEIQSALSEGKISEGHTRPLLMLIDRPEEQQTLFKEIMYKKLTVREAERIARGIAQEKVRRKEPNPEVAALEKELAENLGTRVYIEQRENGGKIHIDFFTIDDLRDLLQKIEGEQKKPGFLASLVSAVGGGQEEEKASAEESPIDDRPKEEQEKEADEDLYSVKNFSL